MTDIKISKEAGAFSKFVAELMEEITSLKLRNEELIQQNSFLKPLFGTIEDQLQNIKERERKAAERMWDVCDQYADEHDLYLIDFDDAMQLWDKQREETI